MLDIWLINFSRSIPYWANSCLKMSKFSILFESALVKTQEEAYDSLVVQERKSVKHLLKLIIETDSEIAGESFAHELIKKRKIEKAPKNRDGLYMKTKLVLTSNKVERFFSPFGYTFNDYRRRLLPENSEAQLFLKLNKGFWDKELLNSYCN